MTKKLNEVNDALRAIAEGNNHFAIGGVISCWADYLEECRRDMVGMIVPAVRLCNEIVAEPDMAKKDAEGILDNLRKLYDFIGGKEVDPGVILANREEQAKKDEWLSFEAEAELAKKRGLVGNCANNRHIMSWDLSDDNDIVCRATGNAEGNEWDFFLEELGRVRAQGTVYGGKWLATRLEKAMRNGMTSYSKHRRKSRINRAARKSAELSAAAKEEK